MKITIKQLSQNLTDSIKSLKEDARAVKASREVVEAALKDGKAYYGINTGFGILAQERISDDQVGQLQHNLILSHAVGVGDAVPKDISRLMVQLKVHALGRGYSGVSVETFRRLMDFLDHDLIPVIPSKGSVGASGDLAPLSHMALPLIGYGEFWSQDGKDKIPAMEGLKSAGLEPIRLQAKDGLALINGTQLMASYAAFVLKRALQLVEVADILAAMSLEALQGSQKPYDERIHDIRPHAGQKYVAKNMRRLLAESEILDSHRNCGKVQDPYSLRCVPQVHGASRDNINHAIGVVETEMNAVTDNPLVFPNGDIISGGNFHGQPLAIVIDLAAIALAELGSISERRSYLLLEGHDGLPRLLMAETGINSGFMIPQYTAAALVSANKVLCHPASVDSIPTSLGQEDHVSMGSIGALKLLSVMQNLEHIFAVEMFTAAQALDFRKPLRPGNGVEAAHQFIRERIPHGEKDYYFKDDLSLCAEIVRNPEFVACTLD